MTNPARTFKDYETALADAIARKTSLWTLEGELNWMGFDPWATGEYDAILALNRGYIFQPLPPRVSLSVAASRLYRLHSNEHSAYEEASAFGAPSECNGDISKGFDRDRLKVALAAGFTTVDALYDAIRARTSDRWVHFFPI